MKKIIAIFVIALVLCIFAAVFIWFKNRTVDTLPSVVNAAELPPNGIHVSAYPIEGDGNIVRVEIIANIPQLAAGFDISVGFDSNSIVPVNNAQNTPATIGDLFTDATMVRNVVVSEQDSHIRLMYVFFGEGVGAIGSGTLATIDFEILPNASITTIDMLDAKLSRINEQGIAEYIPLIIGDPTISLIRDANGNIGIDVGSLPVGQGNILLVAAIGMVAFSIFGLVGLIVMAMKRMRKQNPTIALQH
jgi:hypothetical protein